MNLIAELEQEHSLIERVAGSFRTYVSRLLEGEAPREEVARFLRFFSLFVGAYHHEREDDVLFVTLVSALELPSDRGPLFALTLQHHDLAATLASLEALLLLGEPTPEQRVDIDALCTRYVHGLWNHIDAENSVLFPESEARLARVGLGNLRARGPTAQELEAREDGEALTLTYAPAHDSSAWRGDGCNACPSFGVTCDGLERTWWNEHEWAEAADHLG